MRKIGSIDLKVAGRSGFDKSHRSLFTMECGTLYPILVDELIPNSTIHLKQLLSCQLPPLATDAFANVKVKTEAFFVPYRLLYGGFENWITETPLRSPNGSTYYCGCPRLEISPDQVNSVGNLADFLGFKLPDDYDTSEDESRKVNIFPFLAYHRIYDDWYRNSRIQSPLFVPANEDYASNFNAAVLPFVSFEDNLSIDGTETASVNEPYNGYFADGSYITDLHQRNFGLDYFTSAMPSAQRGTARAVTMQVAEGEASFTIAALRAQNSLQIFSERNGFSYRIEDYNLVNYGARLRRGMATRPVFLGSQSLDVYSKSVYQSSVDPSSSAAAGGSNPNNPFNSTAAKYGSAAAVGDDTIVDSFTTDEAGIFMVIASIVPKVTYNTGTRRYLSHFIEDGSQTDLANHTLQNVGNQPIYRYELVGTLPVPSSLNPAVFGYTDRFAEWMTMEDEVHGYLKDTYMLSMFALQRSFSFESGVTLNSDFLKIPKDYLDQILAVPSETSGTLSAWAEAYFDYKVVQPLAEYSIPSLQDPAYEHGDTVTISKNGGSL